jgi:hypothetical protein
MNKLVSILLIGLLLVTSYGIAQNRVPVNGVIDLPAAMNKDVELLLSTIADHIEYVPLETTPQSLLGGYQNVKAEVLNKFILVHEKRQMDDVPLKLFSRQGKYIGEIGTIGKGPNEYQRILSFSCLEKSDRIYILNDNPPKLLVFNFNRQCTGSIPLTRSAAKVVAFEPDRIGIMYLPFSEIPNDSARFEWIDHAGRVLKSVPLYKGRPKDGGGEFAPRAQLKKIGQEVHFVEQPFDTVYQLSADRGFQPIWTFHYGPDKMPREISTDARRITLEARPYTFISSAFETTDHYFIRAIQKQQIRMILFNKKNHATACLRMNEEYKNFFEAALGFVNDIDGGLPFWPNSGTEGQLVSMTAPEVLKPAFQDKPAANLKLKRPELREKLFKMVDQLKDDDNPVVVIVTTK